MSDYTISAIGHIESPYKQKFAIPRQPRLVPQAKAKLIFAPDFNREEFVRGLDEFTHIWLLFYSMQIDMVVRWTSYFGDTASFHVWGTCITNHKSVP